MRFRIASFIVIGLICHIGMAEELCSKYIQSCDYYLCLEKEFECGQRGYFLDFGHPYCEYYVGNFKSHLSPQGQKWLPKVAQCLREELNRSIETKHFLQCRSLKRFAIQSHADCYFENGYCDLPKSDRKQIIQSIRNDIWHPFILIEGLKLNSLCSQG